MTVGDLGVCSLFSCVVVLGQCWNMCYPCTAQGGDETQKDFPKDLSSSGGAEPHHPQGGGHQELGPRMCKAGKLFSRPCRKGGESIEKNKGV